jgi:hypothetical protein
MAFAGELPAARNQVEFAPDAFAAISRLSQWLEVHDYRGFDTFDGLSSKYLRPLTFETALLRTVLLQGVRRFPINLRPLLGVPAERSTKGMGFLARGFMRMYAATGEEIWAERAKDALHWLMDKRSAGYSGACWGNHFDYQSRTFFLPSGVPTIVWTSLIGHAFLDGYERFGKSEYLDVAVSACEHICKDLPRFSYPYGVCIAYIPGGDAQVHNANTLGGSLLARTYSRTDNTRYRDLAHDAISYTVHHQREDGSWYYGEKENLHWVDNFHTAYVLDCLKHYRAGTGDDSFAAATARGYEHWKSTFFLPDGTPRYYDNKTLPLDIQCSSQAIDTLVFFQDQDPDSLRLAVQVARWTIENMQDRTGYFYYRRYSRWLVNKTPTLHWGQATMLCALSGLYASLLKRESL